MDGTETSGRTTPGAAGNAEKPGDIFRGLLLALLLSTVLWLCLLWSAGLLD